MDKLHKEINVLQWYKKIPLVEIKKPLLIPLSNKRHKHRYATAFCAKGYIALYAKIFDKTLPAIKHTIIHELAHFVQHARYGYTAHDKCFAMINHELMYKYGDYEINHSEIKGTIATSMYEDDD